VEAMSIRWRRGRLGLFLARRTIEFGLYLPIAGALLMLIVYLL